MFVNVIDNISKQFTSRYIQTIQFVLFNKKQ